MYYDKKTKDRNLRSFIYQIYQNEKSDLELFKMTSIYPTLSESVTKLRLGDVKLFS